MQNPGRLLKKSSNRKSKLVQDETSHLVVTTWLSNIAFYLRPIGLHTLQSIQNHARHCLQVLRAAIWSRCAVRFESEQRTFSRAGCRLWCAALHRIRSRTWGFVPMLYSYSETRDWSKDWAKRSARHWLAETSSILSKIHFTRKKKWLVAARNLQIIKPFRLSNWVSIARAVACFPQASRSRSAATAADSETPCVCARHTSRQSNPPKLCWSLAPQELGHWFCSQNLRLSSRIAFGSDFQMTGKGSNLDSNLNSAAYLLRSPWISCVEFEFFLDPLQTPKLRTAVSRYQLSSTKLHIACIYGRIIMTRIYAFFRAQKSSISIQYFKKIYTL